MREIVGAYPEELSAPGFVLDLDLRKHIQAVMEKFAGERETLFDQIRDDFDSGKIDVTDDLVKFLDHWFIEHVNNVDKMYTKAFHEHNIY